MTTTKQRAPGLKQTNPDVELLLNVKLLFFSRPASLLDGRQALAFMRLHQLLSQLFNQQHSESRKAGLVN